MSYAKLLTQLCDIKRPTRATGSARPDSTYSTIASNEKCLLKGGSASENVTEHERTRATYHLFLPWGTDIQSQDRVIIDSKSYELISIYPDPGGRRHHIECQVFEVQ
jgi:hypothetical protein